MRAGQELKCIETVTVSAPHAGLLLSSGCESLVKAEGLDVVEQVFVQVECLGFHIVKTNGSVAAAVFSLTTNAIQKRFRSRLTIVMQIEIQNFSSSYQLNRIHVVVEEPQVRRKHIWNNVEHGSEGVEALQAAGVARVDRFYGHCLHALAQLQVLRPTVRLAAPRLVLSKADRHETSDSFFAENISRATAHVSLGNVWFKVATEIHRRQRIEILEKETQVLHHNERVVIDFQEPVCVIDVIFINVFKC